MAFFSLAALRTILATETDADSPGSEELLSQLRENFEALLMLLFDTNEGGTVTTIAETVLTDSGQAWDVDGHIGRTLLITSGTAIGNTYTIDDNDGTTLTLTGDTLVSDGVQTTDTFSIFYDLKVNADAHDHDGVNAKKVASIADGAADQDAIGASAVGQGELKTTTGTANTGGIGNGNSGDMVVPGGSYAFYPQVKSSAADTGVHLAFATPGDGISTSYVQAMAFDNTSGQTITAYCQVRYVQASGPLNWLFLLRDKETGENRGEWFAPDHCCFGYNAIPNEMPHPFKGFDPGKHNLIIIHPTNSQVKAARMLEKQERNIDTIEALLQLFDIDDSKQATWPKHVEVSIDIDECFDTGKRTVVKEKTKKPEHAKYYKLKEK